MNSNVLFQTGASSNKKTFTFQVFLLCLLNARSVSNSKEIIPRNSENISVLPQLLHD